MAAIAVVAMCKLSAGGRRRSALTYRLFGQPQTHVRSLNQTGLVDAPSGLGADTTSNSAAASAVFLYEAPTVEDLLCVVNAASVHVSRRAVVEQVMNCLIAAARRNHQQRATSALLADINRVMDRPGGVPGSNDSSSVDVSFVAPAPPPRRQEYLCRPQEVDLFFLHRLGMGLCRTKRSSVTTADVARRVAIVIRENARRDHQEMRQLRRQSAKMATEVGTLRHTLLSKEDKVTTLTRQLGEAVGSRNEFVPKTVAAQLESDVSRLDATLKHREQGLAKVEAEAHGLRQRLAQLLSENMALKAEAMAVRAAVAGATAPCGPTAASGPNQQYLDASSLGRANGTASSPVPLMRRRSPTVPPSSSSAVGGSSHPGSTHLVAPGQSTRLDVASPIGRKVPHAAASSGFATTSAAFQPALANPMAPAASTRANSLSSESPGPTPVFWPTAQPFSPSASVNVPVGGQSAAVASSPSSSFSASGKPPPSASSVPPRRPPPLSQDVDTASLSDRSGGVHPPPPISISAPSGVFAAAQSPIAASSGGASPNVLDPALLASDEGRRQLLELIQGMLQTSHEAPPRPPAPPVTAYNTTAASPNLSARARYNTSPTPSGHSVSSSRSAGGRSHHRDGVGGRPKSPRSADAASTSSGKRHGDGAGYMAQTLASESRIAATLPSGHP